MSDQPRDWDKELAEIDKVIAREPAGGPPPATRVGGAAAPVAVPRPAIPVVRKKDRAGSWVRALLTAALGVAIPFWPYPVACGAGLALYSGAVVVLLLASVWTATAAWRRRQGLVHVIALLSLLWGIMLAGSILLPRIGYAQGQLAWVCR
jgi:hypothetical protein